MSRAKGSIAEQKACDYLQTLGFKIIERNFYSRFGEIDIIAKKESILHFVEVKSATSYELAIQNITHQKISRLIKTLDIYMKKKSYTTDYSLDALVVTPTGCEYIEAITL